MTADARKERLLVIDNEPIHVSVLGEILRSDYEILVATSGDRGLSTARTQRPDLILLDIVMPDMDGYEVCRRLKQEASTRDIPIVFLTAKDAVDDEARGFELGAVDYITKPVNPAVVRARVGTQLELKRKRDQLVDLTEMKNKFLAIAAHDLRSPLSSILLGTECVRDRLKGVASERDVQGLEQVLLIGRQMLGLLDGLLDAKRIEQGGFALRLSSARLDLLVRERIEFLKPLTDRKELTVASDLDSLPPFELDSDRVAQTFDNLFTNAIKYSPRGATIRIRLTREGGWARVAVDDEGGGILPDAMKRAFGEFQTLGSTPTEAESSTGLGLYIVKRIVEAHGGQVSLASVPGRGSTFSFSLPMKL